MSKDYSYDSISLKEWVSMHSEEEEIRTVFLNMDRAMRYIHEHGYCIQDFHPSEIEVLNNEPDHIQFKKLMELSSNPITANKMIQEDIFNSSFVQISIYLKIDKLEHLNPDFLRENFDSFAQFLPTGDVPYYRGVIERGAGVYFCDYALEKRNRDLADLEKQLGNNESPVRVDTSTSEMTNSKVNDVIYKQINGLKDTAFVNMLLIPTMVFAALFLMGLIVWIISLF